MCAHGRECTHQTICAQSPGLPLDTHTHALAQVTMLQQGSCVQPLPPSLWTTVHSYPLWGTGSPYPQPLHGPQEPLVHTVVKGNGSWPTDKKQPIPSSRQTQDSAGWRKLRFPSPAKPSRVPFTDHPQTLPKLLPGTWLPDHCSGLNCPVPAASQGPSVLARVRCHSLSPGIPLITPETPVYTRTEGLRPERDFTLPGDT